MTFSQDKIKRVLILPLGYFCVKHFFMWQETASHFSAETFGFGVHDLL